MVSTITVNDEIRRKIKRLAALLDTSQSKIVEIAIALYEKEISREKRNKKADEKIAKILEEARKVVENSDPEWARISKKLRETKGVDIEDIISYRWGEEL